MQGYEAGFPFPQSFYYFEGPHLQIPGFIALETEKHKNQHSDVIMFFKLQQRNWSKGQGFLLQQQCW